MSKDLHLLPDLIREGARRFPAEPALGRMQGRQPGVSELTYAELHEHVRRGAAALQATGLAPGDRVLLLMEGRPEWAAAFFAILEAGLVAVPMPASTSPESAAAAARYAEVRACALSEKTLALAGALAGVRHVSLDDLFASERCPPAPASAGEQDVALLAFTSGSTARPHAVELTHANLLSNLRALLVLGRAEPGDAFLSMLPPAHLFELVVGLFWPIACGARVIYAGALLPNRLVEALRKRRITHALAVPALLDALYEEVLDELVDAGVLDEARRRQRPAETARWLRQEMHTAEMDRIREGLRARIGPAFHSLLVGGAALDPVWAELLPPLGISLEVGYGLTEASPIVSVGRSGACPAGSAGRPLPGIDVRVDERGEILVRGLNVMRGYFREPEATAAALEGGWLHTGDHGSIDEEGFLFVTGRLKEAMVTAAGETLYPEEIEPYYESPLFAEWCVVPLRGPHGNDVPTLLVVAAGPHATLEALRQECDRLRAAAPARCRVAGMRQIEGRLPRTALGKIRRRALAATLDRDKEGA